MNEEQELHEATSSFHYSGTYVEEVFLNFFRSNFEGCFSGKMKKVCVLSVSATTIYDALYLVLPGRHIQSTAM